jgi:hypothetical protein
MPCLLRQDLRAANWLEFGPAAPFAEAVGLLVVVLLVVVVLAELPHAASAKQAPRIGRALSGWTWRPLARSVGRGLWMRIDHSSFVLVVVFALDG